MANKEVKIITAGSTYLDIDAYACMVAMAELLNLQGKYAIAYSTATCNYSVCEWLVEEGQILRELPLDTSEENTKYIIVDVSDPEFLKDSVPLDRIAEVYDHHVGFEDYWKEKIGNGSHIEFIGAAATLIYREWERTGLAREMKISTAKLMIAAILDNTLNLTSSNTTDEDREVFDSLCDHAGVGEDFRASYFSKVQKSVEADLKNALFGDIKTISDPDVLPSRIAQLSVWNSEDILEKLSIIRSWFKEYGRSWMLNVIDIRQGTSYFICDDTYYQNRLSKVFGVRFKGAIANSKASYLRKEIIKKAKLYKDLGG